MFTVRCDTCGADLYINQEATMKLYMDNKDHYRLFEDGVLDESTIVDYIIFTCSKCKEQFKFNYRDWEARYRRDLVSNIMEIKKREAFKNLNPSIIKASSGTNFCGQCTGSEGTGYCLNDIIKQCSVRK